MFKTYSRLCFRLKGVDFSHGKTSGTVSDFVQVQTGGGGGFASADKTNSMSYIAEEILIGIWVISFLTKIRMTVTLLVRYVVCILESIC